MTPKPIRLHQDLVFGINGNETGFLGQGWAEPEPGRRWTHGALAEIRFIHPGNVPLLLLAEAAPHILAPDVPRQRIDLEANGTRAGIIDFTGTGRHALPIPPDLVPARDLLRLRLHLQDAAKLGALGLAPRALCFTRLRLFTTTRVAPRRLPGGSLSQAEFPAATGVTLAEALARFDDIQGHATARLHQALGLEAQTLLAEASLGLPALLGALDSGFAGLGDPGSFDIRVTPFQPDRYTVLDHELNAEFPGRFATMDTPLARLIEQEAGRLKQLRHNLTTLLAAGRKILVAAGQDLTETDALPLVIALNRLGANTLLWLTQADQANPAGTVAQAHACLLRGYCPPAPPSADNLPAWLAVFANALKLVQGKGLIPRPAEAPPARPAPAAPALATRATASPAHTPSAAAPSPARPPSPPAPPPPPSATSAEIYTEVQSLIFGLGGNEETSIGFGWAGEEDGFRWTNGAESELWLEHPGARDAIISMSAWPYLDPPVITAQRIVLIADRIELGSFTFARSGWRGLHVPAAALPASKVLRLVCRLPDSGRPSEISGGQDDRRLGLAFMRLEISSFPAPSPAVLTGSGGLQAAQVLERTGLQPDELVTRFETLGGSNAFADVQSRAGVEPQGLLRYASMDLQALIDQLHNRLARIGATDQLVHSVVHGDPPVYAVTDRATTFHYVTSQTVDELDPETLLVQHARRIRFLRDHLLEDIEAGERIFVYHRHADQEQLTETLMLPLATALRKLGPNCLLYVTETDTSAPPGTVEMHIPWMMHGYLGPAGDEQTSQAQWLELCANALALRPVKARAVGS